MDLDLTTCPSGWGETRVVPRAPHLPRSVAVAEEAEEEAEHRLPAMQRGWGLGLVGRGNAAREFAYRLAGAGARRNTGGREAAGKAGGSEKKGAAIC